MSTTTELLAANERHNRLRAAIAELADAHEAIGWHVTAADIRALLGDQETSR